MSSNPAVQLNGVNFAYRPGRPVLDIAELRIAAGERIFLFGPSGSGKTTLLGLLTGILKPQSGVVSILGQDLAPLSNAGRDRFRGVHIGYIFQLFNLIPYLSVVENIVLPCRLTPERMQRLRGAAPEQAAKEVAGRLGIGELLHEPVANLSVGQQQRVAAARSLMGTPELVVADEPTSSLDFDHRERFIELLFENCATAGTTLIFVSHDRTLLPMFDRAISLPEINRVRT